MTWGFRIKDGLYSVHAASVGCCLSGFVVVAFGTAPGGCLSGWELAR